MGCMEVGDCLVENDLERGCNIHETLTKFQSKELKERDHMELLRIILKWTEVR